MKIWYPIYCSNPGCGRYCVQVDFSLEIDTEDDVIKAQAAFLLSPKKCDVCRRDLQPCCPLPEDDL
jgi:hypothetical protein